ncbi:tetratricopeptide repeat protein [Streptomyces sp. NRRL F-2747]|uniref:tetratricopeptide repeat protein n=2 Tax=unclassified Streptomyces TaxID=2593676 RepID=UPI001F34FD98|nr:tetratricopeptide repeat protein [Streptomyces sp. NRRL F-2747]
MNEAADMRYTQIKAAAKAMGTSLATSTVSELLRSGETRAGRDTEKLVPLVAILLAKTGNDHPAAAPWLDEKAWQARWEALDDRDRGRAAQPPATGTEGVFGWDDPLVGLREGAGIARLEDRRTSTMAATVGGLAALGMYRQARDVAWELQRSVLETHGPRDPEALAVRHVAAYWVGEAGNRRAARAATDTLLAECRAALGEEHALTRLARLRLAAWTTSAGDAAHGRRLYRELARDGSDDRITLLSRLGGARAAKTVGEIDEAEDQLARLMPDLVAEYEAHHPVLFAARIHAAQARWKGTRCAAYGRQSLERLVADATEHLGRAHPLTLKARACHARLVHADGDPQRSLELAEQTHIDALRVLGADHPYTLAAGSVLSVILAAVDLPATRALLGRLCEQAERALGDESRVTLGIRHNLAVVTHHDDPRAARALYEEVRDARTRVLGAEHPHTLLTRLALAYAVLALDGPDAARPLLEEIHRARVRVLGPAHPDVEVTRELLRIAGQAPPALPAGRSEG